MQSIKMKLAEQISQKLDGMLDAAQIAALIESPRDKNDGDFALPCFTLAKSLRKAPQMIAESIAQDFPATIARETVAKSGYLDFFLSDEIIFGTVVDRIISEGEDYGSSSDGAGKTVVIDYSSPNIAKPFHIGHLCSTAIGESLKRILRFKGFTVVGVNHLGDYGTQFGKLIVSYRLWGDDEKIASDGVNELVNIYVRFHREAEENPALNDEARAWFARLENGDSEAVAIWQRFNDISLIEFERLYKRLGVSFEYYTGESFYIDKMGAVVDELREKGLLKLDQGAYIVDLEKYNMPPLLIIKSDGTSIYATRDLATAIYRRNTFNFYKSVYITSYTQNLHFAQIIAVLGEMGYEWSKDMVHVPHGQVSVMGKKMATREGNMLNLEEILATSVSKAREIIEKKNPNLPNKDEVAEKVGVGAVIFSHLSNGRIRDMDFNWDDALNFEGNTGPYLQYSYARTCSVIENAKEYDGDAAVRSFTHPAERELAMTLALFPEKVSQAIKEYEPSVVTRYLLDLCGALNYFYNECHILRAEPDVRAMRVKLAKSAKSVLGRGLTLICMAKTEKI